MAPTKPPLAWTAERLFERFFAPYYAPGDLDRLPALRSEDANPAGNPAIVRQIEEAADVFTRMAPTVLERPDLVLDYTDASVHHLAAALTRPLRDAWSTDTTEPPTLTNVVLHGCLYVGMCIVRNHGGRWLVRRPLWESQVELSSPAGTAHLALFQWWLKALADPAIDTPSLADRYHLLVEQPTRRAEGLPVIATPRPLPRLKKVRYDTLHKHLRAHLPELRSVGDDFPNPERFAELGFRWLDFRLIGQGRMLLVLGPGENGVHVFWLSGEGFQRAAFFETSAAADPTVAEDGDRLVLTIAAPDRSEAIVHEMLWWGA